jgi:hypothetical protein
MERHVLSILEGTFKKSEARRETHPNFKILNPKQIQMIEIQKGKKLSKDNNSKRQNKAVIARSASDAAISSDCFAEARNDIL